VINRGPADEFERDKRIFAYTAALGALKLLL
jgi:hypothetical protein